MYSLYKDPSGEIKLDFNTVTQSMTKEQPKKHKSGGDVNLAIPATTINDQTSSVSLAITSFFLCVSCYPI